MVTKFLFSKILIFFGCYWTEFLSLYRCCWNLLTFSLLLQNVLHNVVQYLLIRLSRTCFLLVPYIFGHITDIKIYAEIFEILFGKLQARPVSTGAKWSVKDSKISSICVQPLFIFPDVRKCIFPKHVYIAALRLTCPKEFC